MIDSLKACYRDRAVNVRAGGPVAGRVSRAVAVVLSTVVLLGCCGAAPATDRVWRVMPLGDSITRGAGDGWRGPFWSRVLAAGGRVDLVGSQNQGSFGDPQHEGHGGWRIDQLTAIAAEQVRRFAPDVVLLMAGTNDLLQRRWAGMPGRLEILVRTVRAARPGVRVLLASVPQMQHRSRGLVAAWNTFRAAVPVVAARTGATWVRGDLVAYPSDLVADGVHPSRCGYARLGWLWWQGWTRAVRAPAGRPWRVGAMPARCS